MTLLRIGLGLIAVGVAWIGLGVGMRLFPLNPSPVLLAAIGVAGLVVCGWPLAHRRGVR